MRLALAMGRADVDRMLSEMSGADVAEWMAFEKVEPFLAEQMNVFQAHICSVLVNMWKSKESKAAKLADYLLRWERPAGKGGEVRQEAGQVPFQHGVKKGYVNVYDGGAPGIRRIGKRGKRTKRKEKLWRILDG